MSTPNVVIFKSDQLNAHCLGINGHQQVRTPNVDALARDGVNFTRAFVQSPICTPSRMSYLTGQYVHNHGVFGNSSHEIVPSTLPSQFSTFRQHGYYTGIVGTVHVREEWLRPHCDLYRRIGGAYPGSVYDDYLAAKGLWDLRDDGAFTGYPGLGRTAQPPVHILDGCPSELSFEDSFDGYCYQTWCGFLDQRPPGAPFLFQVDTVHPHPIYVPVREFWDLYEGIKLTLPPSADEDLSGKPLYLQRVKERFLSDASIWEFEPKTYAAGRLRGLRGYFGCISQVDHLVGLVRQKLEQIGALENTIFLFCADHGDYALEHGFLSKEAGISYDAITRVPFIWSWPGGDFARGTVDELVAAVDVFPTMCALAGVATPDTIDGHDLSGLLRGDVQPSRDAVFTELPLSRVIRTREWKLCHRPRDVFPEGGEGGELYHLSADPWEMQNLYADPRYADVREELLRALFDWLVWSTRYGNVTPPVEAGADGKTTPPELRRLVDEGKLHAL